MAPKADKLAQNIDSIKSFLRRKLATYPELNEVIEKIKYIEKTLNEKKLTLQIISNNETLNQALFDLISNYPEFTQTYQIKYDLNPSSPLPISPQIKNTLTLKRLIVDSTEIIEEYILEKDHNYLIGRCPENPIFLDSNIYQGISWKHAEINPIENKQGEIRWQITDLNSSNGTFINGEKLNGSIILNNSDTITLAYPELKANIPCFEISQESINFSENINNEYQYIIDCDLLLLILDNNNLSHNEKEFLVNLDISFLSKVFIIVDFAEESHVNLEETNTNLENQINSLNIEYKIELFFLKLKAFYQEEGQENLTRIEQKNQDKFIKALSNIIKRQPENILAKRLTAKLNPLVSPLEQILIQEDEELKEKIKESQDKLTKITQKNWKEITKNAISNVKEEKDKFFKQIKSDLAQAKNSVLDNFSKRSIVGKIQNFVDELQPTIFKKQGQPYVKLLPVYGDINADLNEVLIKFTTNSVEKWALKEWDKIINHYNHGGLNDLLKRVYTYVDVIPDLFSESPFSPPAELDIANNFLISFMGIESEVRHKQVSMGGYIMKTLRANMMQIMMMATMLLAILGQKMGKNEIFGQLSQWFQRFPFLLGLAVFALIFFLTNSYNQDNNLKLEEAEDKLKKEVNTYYQSLSKNLIEKVIQDINLALEYEANRIDSALERVQEIYGEYISETEKQQVIIKANLESLKEKEKNLSKEIIEFKKLANT